MSGTRIGEVPFDQSIKAETFVQRAREQQPGIGGDCCAAELDAKLGIEREANRARCRVTHWVVPSASARNPREPRFLRVLSDYGPLRSAFKSKMWAWRRFDRIPAIWQDVRGGHAFREDSRTR